MTQNSCPSDHERQAFSQGELPAGEIERLIQHIDQCERCQQKFEQLDQPSESVSGIEASLEKLRFHEAHDATATIARLLAPHPSDDIRRQHADVPTPNQIGPYRIIAPLASGGMGVVYRARHLHLARDFAVKLLGDTIENRAQAQQVLNEWRTHGQLSHPNVVTATDAGIFEGRPYLVTELIDGADLSTLIRKMGPRSVSESAAILQGVANGLSHAHEMGIAHLDVKPSNIMLDRSGRVRLLDLGTAIASGNALAKSDLPGTDAKGVFGTLAYLAPERIESLRRGESLGDALVRCDFYSLGCTLHYLITGQPPFGIADDTRSTADIIRHHRRSPAPRLMDEVSGSNDVRSLKETQSLETAQALIDTLMAKDPAERPADMKQVSGLLGQMIAPEESPDAICKSIASVASELDSSVRSVRSGETIQVTDLFRESRSNQPMLKRLVLGTTFIAMLLGVLYGVMSSTKNSKTVVETESSSEPVVAPFSQDTEVSLDWKYRPRWESGFAFRSRPLLQWAKAQDPLIHRVSIKTVNPRRYPMEITWSTDGTRLAVLSDMNQIRVFRWDGQRLVLTHVWRQKQHAIEHIAWNPLDHSLLVTSEHLLAIVELRDSGKLKWTTQNINCPAIQSLHCVTSNRRCLVLIETSQGLIGWDPQQSATVEPSPGSIAQLLSVSPNRNRFVCLEDDRLDSWAPSWDGANWQFKHIAQQTVKEHRGIESMRWSDDGRYVVIAGRRRTRVHAGRDLQFLGEFQEPLGPSFTWAVSSPLRIKSTGEATAENANTNSDSLANQQILAFVQANSLIQQPFTVSDEGFSLGQRVTTFGAAGNLRNARVATCLAHGLMAVTVPGELEIWDREGNIRYRSAPIQPIRKAHLLQLQSSTILYRNDGGCVVVNHDGQILGQPIPRPDNLPSYAQPVGPQSVVEPELDLYQANSKRHTAIKRSLLDHGVEPGTYSRHTFAIVPESSTRDQQDDSTSVDVSTDSLDDWTFGRLYRPPHRRQLGESPTMVRKIPHSSLRLTSMSENGECLVIASPEGAYRAYWRGLAKDGTTPRTGTPPAIACDETGALLYGTSHDGLGTHLWCQDLQSNQELWKVFDHRLRGYGNVTPLGGDRLLLTNWFGWQIRDATNGKLVKSISPREMYGFRHSAVTRHQEDHSLLSSLPIEYVEPIAHWSEDLELNWFAFTSGPQDWLFLSSKGRILSRSQSPAPYATRFRKIGNGATRPIHCDAVSPPEAGLCVVGHHRGSGMTILPLERR